MLHLRTRKVVDVPSSCSHFLLFPSRVSCARENTWTTRRLLITVLPVLCSAVQVSHSADNSEGLSSSLPFVLLSTLSLHYSIRRPKPNQKMTRKWPENDQKMARRPNGQLKHQTTHNTTQHNTKQNQSHLISSHLIQSHPNLPSPSIQTPPTT